jgi:hypothetical protein
MDARLGCLSVHLDTPQCFSAEIYAMDLNVAGAQEDLKVCLWNHHYAYWLYLFWQFLFSEFIYDLVVLLSCTGKIISSFEQIYFLDMSKNFQWHIH